MGKYKCELNKLWILSFVCCVVIVVPALLAGCQSKEDNADKPAPLSPEQIFAKASPAVVYIIVRDKDFKPIGLGSGFFIDSKGLIVTNYHVIKGAAFATVLRSNKSTLFVDGVTAIDADNDLAILKVSGKGFVSLKAADALPKIGSVVYAIGNPRGLENTFSGGMVSGHREFKQGVKVIQTTTPISPGSSGGPLLNDKGEVVGVTTSFLKGSQNLNFAVPMAMLQSLIGTQRIVKTLASAGNGQFDSGETEELDKAWAAIAKRDWTVASRILVALRKTQKRSPFVWYALGFLHGELGNHEIAIQHYKATIALKSGYAEAYYNMGIAYMQLKRYPDAIAAYKKAIALKPDHAEAYCATGIAYKELKRYAEAITACKKAIEVKSDYAKAYCDMGGIYRACGQYSDAIAIYKKAIALKLDNAGSLRKDVASVYKHLAIRHYISGRYPDAIAAYKKAIVFEPDASTYRAMCFPYTQLKRYPEALAACKKAIALKPDYVLAYDSMGYAYRESGQYLDAISAYEKAVAVKPNATTYRSISGTYDTIARDYKELKRYAEAIAAYKKSIAAYEKAIALKPDDTDSAGNGIDSIYENMGRAYKSMGDAYSRAGRYSDAIAAYKLARKAGLKF